MLLGGNDVEHVLELFPADDVYTGGSCAMLDDRYIGKLSHSDVCHHVQRHGTQASQT